MYQPNNAWPNNDIPTLLNGVYQRSYHHLATNFSDELYLLNDLITDFEEYIFQCFYFGLINDYNYQHIIERLQQINIITLLPANERGIYGKFQDDCIFVNPDLPDSAYLNGRARQRLYTFHELGHAIINIEQNQPSSEEYYGWKLLEEGITQEVAEQLTYNSLDSLRFPKHIQTFPQLFDHEGSDNYRFSSNYDYYGYIQPIVTAISNSLFWNDNPPASCTQDYTVYKLCAMAFEADFTNNLYNAAAASRLGTANLSKILTHMGFLFDSNYTILGLPRLHVSYTGQEHFSGNNRYRMEDIFTTVNRAR